MKKVLSFINIIITVVLVGILLIFGDDYSKREIFFNVIALFVCVINICIFNEWKKEEDNCDRLAKDKVDLEYKITELAINMNDKSPYNIQEYIDVLCNGEIIKNNYYITEIIISTIDTKYPINYFSILLDKKLDIKQCNEDCHSSDYRLENGTPNMKNGSYEYVFIFCGDKKIMSQAKCQFQLRCKKSGKYKLTMIITGDNPAVDKKKVLEINAI